MTRKYISDVSDRESETGGMMMELSLKVEPVATTSDGKEKEIHIHPDDDVDDVLSKLRKFVYLQMAAMSSEKSWRKYEAKN